MSREKISCNYCGTEVLQRNLSNHHKSIKCKLSRKEEIIFVDQELENLRKRHEELQKDYNEIKTDLAVAKNTIEMLRELLAGKDSDSKEEKKVILKLAETAKTTNTNTSHQNLVFQQLPRFDLTEQHITDRIQYYTLEHFEKGAEGMAEWLGDYVLSDEEGNNMYMCGDLSRLTFQWKDINGNKIADPHAKKLTALVMANPVLKAKFEKFYQELLKNLQDAYTLETEDESITDDRRVSIIGEFKSSKEKLKELSSESIKGFPRILDPKLK